jgi:hypothetical protein
VSWWLSPFELAKSLGSLLMVLVVGGGLLIIVVLALNHNWSDGQVKGKGGGEAAQALTPAAPRAPRTAQTVLTELKDALTRAETLKAQATSLGEGHKVHIDYAVFNTFKEELAEAELSRHRLDTIAAEVNLFQNRLNNLAREITNAEAARFGRRTK